MCLLSPFSQPLISITLVNIHTTDQAHIVHIMYTPLYQPVLYIKQPRFYNSYISPCFPPTSHYIHLSKAKPGFKKKWKCWDSNPGPPACKAGALPLSYTPLAETSIEIVNFYEGQVWDHELLVEMLINYHMCTKQLELSWVRTRTSSMHSIIEPPPPSPSWTTIKVWHDLAPVNIDSNPYPSKSTSK